ncbi:MAG: M20/M25/M40 family metallo-hydrolase, partial [Clostridia bacterium]|nr:M20/M25/M40 family metallo-hydrolase [Clostridia bacterium]
MEDKKLLYAEQFSRMLQVPTVTDTDQALFDELHKVMGEIAPDFFKLPLAKPRKNALVFKWEGKKHDRPLVLMGHQDVVPEGDPSMWKYPPYGGVIAEDRIWGRGALDCKSTVFASMVAADELIKAGFVPEQDIYFCYGDDEENSGGGAKAEADYLTSIGVKPVLVLDEGGGMMQKEAMPQFLAKSAGVVGICEKGFADIRFYAPSNGGHSSTPGKNTPFVRLAKFILYCEKHQIFEKKTLPLVKEMLVQFSKAVKPVLKPIVRYAYIFAPLAAKVVPSLAPQLNAFFQTTMVFTMSKGADASNNIPDKAWVLANLRYAPHEGCEACMKKLKKIAKKYDIEIEIDNTRDASPIADTKSAEYKFAVDMINKTYGETIMAPYLVCGGTDCRNMQEICHTALRFTPFLVSMAEMNCCHAY